MAAECSTEDVPRRVGRMYLSPLFQPQASLPVCQEGGGNARLCLRHSRAHPSGPIPGCYHGLSLQICLVPQTCPGLQATPNLAPGQCKTPRLQDGPHGPSLQAKAHGLRLCAYPSTRPAAVSHGLRTPHPNIWSTPVGPGPASARHLSAVPAYPAESLEHKEQS